MEHVERETNHVHVVRFELVAVEEERNERNEEGRTLLKNPRRSGWNGAKQHFAILRIPSVPRGEEEQSDENGDSDANQAEGDDPRDGAIEEVRHDWCVFEGSGVVLK